jgi:predicted transcriptional regulator
MNTILSEKERREIEEQTLLLWIANMISVSHSTFDYGGWGRYRLPEFDHLTTLRRCRAKGLLDCTYKVRGWYVRAIYTVATKSPAEKIIEYLDMKGWQQLYEISSHVNLEKETVRTTLNKMIKRGDVEMDWHPNEAGWYHTYYRLIPLPF